MVEAVVFFTAQRLGKLLIQEAVFLRGVHEQVDELQRELRRMQCFLQDAEAKQVTDESIRNWVADVRDIAYDSEDVIDTFILKVALTRKGIREVLKSYVCIFDNKWVHLHKVGIDIQSILARIEKISGSRLTYGIANIGESSISLVGKERLQKQLRESYPHVDDEDVIGLEDHIDTLVSELIKVQEQRRVISIVGVGGLGKTTLAKKVYKHDVVQRSFDCFGWTSISQQCSRSDALCEILKKTSALTDQEMEATRKMTEKDLVEKLFTFLEGRRYLVVLDDIWQTEDWDILRPAFPNGKMGSKVLLTTRNKKVAAHADPHNLHLEPRCLTEDESWTLLRKKAFPKNVASINCSVADFEKLGKEMLKKCGGLPLGVVVLGGLLATKGALIYEWEAVRRSINSYMNKGQTGVSAILALSYIDLPFHLKPCFLYFAFFPEDSEISRKKLVHLWVSEGFIKQQQKGQATMEDVGEEQLADLAQRCMVQIGKRCRASGRIKTCRLHDLMRELCLMKAREEGFLEIYVDHHESVMTTVSSSFNRLRRYAIHSDTKKGYVSLPNLTTSHLRSLMIVNSNTYIDFDTSNLKVCYQNFKLLRVLDLQSTRIRSDDLKHATKQIGKLIHLVYLGMAVKGCNGKISESICKLRSLQTLHLSWVKGCLPNTMWEMGQLRHLYLNRSTNTCNWRMSTWTNIHTLYWIHAGEWIEGGDLEKMTSLRKLGICALTTSQARVVLESSIILNRSSSSFNSPSSSTLGSLSLDMSSGNSFPNLLANAFSGCHHLFKLFLRGHIETLPRFSPNLTKLTLILSALQRDPMQMLEDLPNLKYLYLGDSSYKGSEMVCSFKGFPQLQFLTLECLPKCRVWEVQQGAMPHLQCLKIKLCEMMEMVPEGLRFVTSLQELVVEFMSREFNRRIVIGGEDWYKVKHIPSIKTSNQKARFVPAPSIRIIKTSNQEARFIPAPSITSISEQGAQAIKRDVLKEHAVSVPSARFHSVEPEGAPPVVAKPELYFEKYTNHRSASAETESYYYGAPHYYEKYTNHCSASAAETAAETESYYYGTPRYYEKYTNHCSASAETESYYYGAPHYLEKDTNHGPYGAPPVVAKPELYFEKYTNHHSASAETESYYYGAPDYYEKDTNLRSASTESYYYDAPQYYENDTNHRSASAETESYYYDAPHYYENDRNHGPYGAPPVVAKPELYFEEDTNHRSAEVEGLELYHRRATNLHSTPPTMAKPDLYNLRTTNHHFACGSGNFLEGDQEVDLLEDKESDSFPSFFSCKDDSVR